MPLNELQGLPVNEITFVLLAWIGVKFETGI